ncbi:MAG: hypothetical protein ACJ8MH_20075 [Povalibacter sp.]
MTRSSITGLIVAVGVLVIVGWIAKNTYWDETRVPTPLKGEALTNPFYSVQQLAQRLGATAERRQVLGTPPSTDAVLVLTHWHWSVIESRRRAMEAWVEAGGRLVLDRTLSGEDEQFEHWSGISRTQPPDENHAHSSDADADGADTKEEPEEPDEDTSAFFPIGTGICGMLDSNPPVDNRERFHVCNLAEASQFHTERIPEWELTRKGKTQAVRMKVGRGSVTWLNAAPFGNRELLELDHAVLFVAATQLHDHDQIVFLSEERRASLLAMIWNHGAPVVVLLLIVVGMALWRGAVRFGPLTGGAEPARRSIAEQIRGTGQFALRFGAGRALHAAMVRALHETAARRIPGYSSLSVVDRVAAIARVTQVDAEKLSQTIHHSGPRRANDLRNALVVLEYTRRRLLTENISKGRYAS